MREFPLLRREVAADDRGHTVTPAAITSIQRIPIERSDDNRNNSLQWTEPFILVVGLFPFYYGDLAQFCVALAIVLPTYFYRFTRF